MRLVYGVCAGPSGKFERLAGPSIEKVDPGATILVRRGQRSIHDAYNSIIDEAQGLAPDGLVLIHDDVVLRNTDLPQRLATLLADPSVGIVGPIGAANVHSAEWWLYDAHGWVEENEMVIDLGAGTFDVDVLDGLFLAFSPVAMRQLRFDTHRFSGFHGYDLDICMQAKAAGLRVVVADLDVLHDSYPHGKITDPEAYRQANRAWRAKWRPGLVSWCYYAKAVWADPWTSRRAKLRRLARFLATPMKRVVTLVIRGGRE